jgi:hypothetical protein
MKFRSITQFLIIGIVVGTFLPFFLSICLFGQTLQAFVAAPPPAGGFWSGAPTPMPTPVPSAVQVVTGTALSSAGGLGFVLWSVLGAFAGEALMVRRWGKDLGLTRMALFGAVVGSALFIVISLFGLPR